MNVIIQNKNGEIVSESKNLAMLRRRTTKCEVKEIHIDRSLNLDGRLTVKFKNGDWSTIKFGSYQLLCHWVGNWKSVVGTKLVMDNKNRGVVSKDNIYLQKGNQLTSRNG